MQASEVAHAHRPWKGVGPWAISAWGAQQFRFRRFVMLTGFHGWQCRPGVIYLSVRWAQSLDRILWLARQTYGPWEVPGFPGTSYLVWGVIFCRRFSICW